MAGIEGGAAPSTLVGSRDGPGPPLSGPKPRKEQAEARSLTSLPPARVLAIDLDGTALHDDKSMGMATQQAIKKAFAQGVVVVVASGRMPNRIFRYSELLPPTFYAVAFSGGLILKWHEGAPQVLHEASLPVPVINSFLDFAKRYNILDGFGIYEKDCLYINNERVARELKQVGIPFSLIKDMEGRFRDSVHGLKIWVYRRPSDPEKERAMTQELTRVVEPHGGTLICFTESYEIVSSSAGKENAMAELCRQLGFKLEEDVLAFGDEGNDIKLLQRARYSVAPSNACEEAKAAARKVSPHSNDQDCVGREIDLMLQSLTLGDGDEGGGGP